MGKSVYSEAVAPLLASNNTHDYVTMSRAAIKSSITCCLKIVESGSPFDALLKVLL